VILRLWTENVEVESHARVYFVLFEWTFLQFFCPYFWNFLKSYSVLNCTIPYNFIHTVLWNWNSGSWI
jgi:hypothetical protein